MANKTVGSLRKASNADIINAVRANASLDYQQRVPLVTKENLSSGLAALDSDRQTYNEFLNILINRIGTTVVQSKSWSNPLAEFKVGKLGMGESIQEIMTGLLESYTYNAERDYGEKMLFGTERPDVKVQYHHVTRQEFYKISVNEDILKRAFVEDGTLGSFVSSLMDAPVTSDNWDEFLLMCSLFAEYERNGGFFHVHVDEFGAKDETGLTDAEVARDALYKMRVLADNMTFLSTKYNAASMPTFAKPDDMILFATPEFANKLDVEGLASLFNVNYAEVPNRIVKVPADRFDVDGCQGILTTRDFFKVADTLLENTSQPNPVSLTTNYFMHHHEIISASRFVPAVMLWNGRSDEKVSVIPGVESLTLDVVDAEGNSVTRYQRNRLYEVVVTPTPANAAGNPQVTKVSASYDDKTYVKDGLLHVGGKEYGQIKLRALMGGVSVEKTLTFEAVEGDEYDDWPNPAGGPVSLVITDVSTAGGSSAEAGTVIPVSEATLTQAGNAYTYTFPSATLPQAGHVKAVFASGYTSANLSLSNGKASANIIGTHEPTNAQRVYTFQNG